MKTFFLVFTQFGRDLGVRHRPSYPLEKFLSEALPRGNSQTLNSLHIYFCRRWACLPQRLLVQHLRYGPRLPLQREKLRGGQPRGVVVQQLPALELERAVFQHNHSKHYGNRVVAMETEPLFHESDNNEGSKSFHSLDIVIIT